MKAIHAIFAASVFVVASADPCDVADLTGSYDACAAVPGCLWCVSKGFIPAQPHCASSIDRAGGKAVYTCSEIPRVQPQPVQASLVDDDCDDDDNDICDLHKRDQSGCMANPMCTWCVSSGLVPATPDCVLTTDAPFIPKQIYTCAAKKAEVAASKSNEVCSLNMTPALCASQSHCAWCSSSFNPDKEYCCIR